jgi:hypothetical protein
MQKNDFTPFYSVFSGICDIRRTQVPALDTRNSFIFGSMLRLTSKNGMAIYHLAKKAKKKILLYEQNKADRVNVPFYDELQKKTRYLTFWRNREGEWGFTGANDEPEPPYIT